MKFWIFMLIMDLMIPLTMIGFGKYFLRRAPKEINAIFGYRTAMSMKNKDTWEFAHRYCGKLWYFWGKVLLLLSIVFMCLISGQSKDIVGILGGILCDIQLVWLIGSIFPTERALKKNFDKDGNRRENNSCVR
jgi:uncharacterized membrane protein